MWRAEQFSQRHRRRRHNNTVSRPDTASELIEALLARRCHNHRFQRALDPISGTLSDTPNPRFRAGPRIPPHQRRQLPPPRPVPLRMTHSGRQTTEPHLPHQPRRATKPPPHSGCNGPSNAPTRGCRTSDNSAATPTVDPSTDSPNSPSPSSYSSASNASTGETAGHHLSADALSSTASLGRLCREARHRTGRQERGRPRSGSRRRATG